MAALQADLDALDRLDAEYGDSEKTGAKSLALLFDENKSSLAGVVREAIESFEDRTFTKGDVLAWLKEKHPTVLVSPASVASFLAKLGKSGGLRIVQPGSGKMPAKYQQPNPPVAL